MKYETDLPILVTDRDTSSTDVTYCHVATIRKQYYQAVPDYCAVTFSDGKRRYFDGELSVDIINQGVGGLDVVPALQNRFYCFYLIPDASDDDQCLAIASVNEPDVGPVGYSIYRYVGRIRHYFGLERQLNDGCWSHVMYNPSSYELLSESNLASNPGAWGARNLFQTALYGPPSWSTAFEAQLIAYTPANVVDAYIRTCPADADPAGMRFVGAAEIRNISGDYAGLYLGDTSDTYFTADMVGRKITLESFSDAGNNGTFPVTAYVSVREVMIYNPSAVASTDASATVYDAISSTACRIDGNSTSDRSDSLNGRQLVTRHADSTRIACLFPVKHPDSMYLFANGIWDNLLEC